MGLIGFQGTVAKDLALSFSIVIACSFLVSIVLIPVLASLLMRSEDFTSGGIITSGIKSLENKYISLLSWLHGRKYVVLIAVAGIITGSFFLFGNIQKEFFPRSEEHTSEL